MPNKIGREGVEANKNGDFNPPSGSFFYGMLKGNPDAGVNTVCNVASLVKSIDPCEKTVKKERRLLMFAMYGKRKK